jgi:2-polyprenyl-3-methyl-5-hydroxy-6-metoxy-1,4-benzoquinol methylase
MKDRELTSPYFVSCPKCGETSRQFISSSDVNRTLSDEVFNYYRCSTCELIFLSPVPSDLFRFYEGGYQKIPRTLSQLRGIAKKERYRLDAILKYKNSGELLEIGPWMGIFSCNAKDAGFDVTAIEMDARCVNFLRDTVGVKAIQSDDPSAAMDEMNEEFDVIVMWHCLEHMPRPWEVLRSASHRLKSNGILLVAVPDIESYDFQTLRERWLHLDAPRHLSFYTANVLEKVCSECELSKLEITTHDRLSAILSRNAWADVANRMLPIRLVRRLLALYLYSVAQRKSKGHGSGLTGVFLKS